MFSEEDRQFLRYSGNFHINLVTVKDIAEQKGHSESEFWLLMNALHIMNQEKPDLSRLAQDTRYEDVPNRLIRCLNTIAGTNIPLSHKKGGRVNMYSVIRKINEQVAERDQVIAQRDQVIARIQEERDWFKQESARFKQESAQRDEELARVTREKAQIEWELMQLRAQLAAREQGLEVNRSDTEEAR